MEGATEGLMLLSSSLDANGKFTLEPGTFSELVPSAGYTFVALHPNGSVRNMMSGLAGKVHCAGEVPCTYNSFGTLGRRPENHPSITDY